MVSLSQGRTAAAQCGLFTYKSVPVIFEPPCKCWLFWSASYKFSTCFMIMLHRIYIYSVSGMFRQTSGVNSPYKNKKSNLHCYISANTYYSFQTIALQRFWLSPLDHCRHTHLNPPPPSSSVFSSIWKWTGTTPTHFQWLSNTSQPFRDVWKGESSWSDVFVRELIQMEDILSICCEFWL